MPAHQLVSGVSILCRLSLYGIIGDKQLTVHAMPCCAVLAVTSAAARKMPSIPFPRHSSPPSCRAL